MGFNSAFKGLTHFIFKVSYKHSWHYTMLRRPDGMAELVYVGSLEQPWSQCYNLKIPVYGAQ